MAVEKAVKFSERNPEKEFTNEEINAAIETAMGRIANKGEYGGIEAKEKTYRWAEPAIEANKKLLAPYKKPEEDEWGVVSTEPAAK